MKDKTRILVVEDEPIVAEDIKVRLELLGYQVAGMARNAQNALALAEKEHPDLVLMDIRLEGEMDGIQAADIIRKRWHLPVIFLTAYSEDVTITSAKLTEPFGYILKPFEDRELKTAIEMGLYKHRIENELRLNKEFAENLIKSLGDGLLVINKDGSRSIVNEALCNMTGFTKEELLGDKLPNLIWPPEHSKEIQVAFESMMAGNSNERDLIFMRKNGERFPVIVSPSYLTNEQGEISNNIVIIKDITQRKRGENILRLQKDIASALSVPGDIDKILDRILSAFSCIDGIDSGGIYISDRITGDLILKAHYGFSSQFVQEVTNYARDTPQWRLVRAGLPAYLKYPEDIEKRSYLLTEGLRGVAVIPVVHQGRVIGSLNIGSHTFDEIPVHTRLILETIAGSLSEVITRIKSEEELKDTQNYLNAIIKSSYDSIFVINEEGRFEFGNEAFFQLMGYADNELLGHSFMKVIHPDYHEFILNRWEEVQRGEGRPYEVDIVRKDGDVRSLSVSHTDMELGGKRKYCVIAKDVTQRKHSEAQMRESEERFRLAFNNAPIGMAIVGLDESIIRANTALCKILGYTEAELTSKTVPDITHPDDITKEATHKGMLKDGVMESFQVVKRYIHADGHSIIGDLSVSLVKDIQGKPLYYIGQMEDITERRRAEEQIREITERLAMAQEAGKIGTFDWHIQDNKTIWTDQMEAMYGFPPGGFGGRNEEWEKTLHPDDHDLVMAHAAMAMSEKKDIEIEYRIIWPDGSVHWILDKARTIYSDSGIPLRMIGVNMDITQRKHAEEALKESEEMLKLHEIRLHDMLELNRLAGATEKEIFDFTLEASLRAVQSDFTFIGFMTADEAVMINCAWSKKVMPLCQTSEKPVEYEIEHAGLWGEVIRQRRPLIVNDYETTEEFKKGYPQGHVPIKRLLGIPIFSGTKIVVVACVANKGSDYTESDVSAFTSLIHEMWDILEHRRKEEEVSKNRAMLLKAQEIGHVGSWEWDITTNDVVWTKEIYNIYGLDPSKVKPNYDLILRSMSPESKAEFLKAIDDALKLGKTFDMQYSLIRPDGARAYVHTKGEVRFDREGHPSAMFGMVQDITQRKQAEDDLRKSEERFRKLIEAEPECVKLLTEDNILVDMNPAGLGMIEADSREQVVGKSIMGIIDPAYRKAFADVGRSVFKGESARLEFSITGLKGIKRWLETHAVPLRDDNGKINFLLAVTRDITERKLVQEERIHLIAREQAALAEAQAARKLDRLKSMFIASTSHELRTPLNSIIGFTSLILDGASGELNPDQKEQLEIVHSSGKHLLALINDIIDLSMIESGRVRVLVCEFNLRQVVDEAVSNNNVNLNEKNLELKVDVNDITMRSDRTRLLQCIINLLSNAIKYTEKGCVEITGKVNDDNLELSVIDTGIGIKAEDFPKLFGPFVRLQSPLMLRTSGTGLGLYLVKKLARDFLGGNVEVKSEFGKGSTFTLRVPIELEGKL